MAIILKKSQNNESIVIESAVTLGDSTSDGLVKKCKDLGEAHYLIHKFD